MSDDADLDFDLDDDLDFDIDGGMEPPAAKIPTGREAVLNVPKEAAKGVAGKILDPARRKALILDSLPREYEAATNAYDLISDNVSDVYDEAKSEVVKTSREVKRIARSATPALKKFLPKSLSDKITKWAEPEESNSFGQEVDQNQLAIDSALGSIFEQQQVAQEDALKSNVEDKVRQAAEDVRSSKMHDVLVGLHTNSSDARSYRNTVTTNYRKKMLELAFRQTFALQELVQVATTRLDALNQNSEGILKNTALPDYAKEQFSEVTKGLMKRDLARKLSPASFAKEYFESASKRAIEKIQELGGGLRDAISMGGDMAAQMSEGDSFGDAPVLTPEEQTGKNVQRGARLAGSMIAGKFINPKIEKLQKKLREAGEANSTVSGIGNRLEYELTGLPDRLNDFFTGRSGGDGEGSDIARNLLGDIFGRYDGDRGSLAYGEMDNLEQVTPWTNRNDITINEVIPGWLSKIHHAITDLSGNPVSPETYDFQKAKFVSQDEINKTTRKTLDDSESNKYIMDRIDGLMDIIDPDGVLGKEDRETLGRYIDNKIRTVGQVDIKSLAADPGILARFGTGDLFKISSILQGHVEGDEHYKVQNTIGKTIQSARSRVAPIQDKVDALEKRFGKTSLAASSSFIDDGRGIGVDKGFLSSYDSASAGATNTGTKSSGKANPFVASRTTENTSNQVSIDLSIIKDDIISSIDGGAGSIVTAIESLKKPEEKSTATNKNDFNDRLIQTIKAGNVVDQVNAIVGMLENISTSGIMMSDEVPDSGTKKKSKFGNLFGGIGKFGSGIKDRFKGALNFKSKIKMPNILGMAGTAFGNVKDFASTTLKSLRGALDIYDADGNIALQGRLLKLGKYFDADGNVIKNINDIKGAVYDAAGQVVISEDDIRNKLHGFTTRTKKGLVGLGELIGTSLGSFIKSTKDKVSSKFAKIKDFALDIKDRFSIEDIYVGGEKEPRLRKHLLLKGFYLSLKTGKPIKSAEDIDGPVVTADGTLVISDGDFAKPGFKLVNWKGIPFKGTLGKIKELATSAFKLATSIGSKAIGKGKELFDLAMNKAKGGVDFISSLIGGKFSKSDKTKPNTKAFKGFQKKVTSRLDDIYNILNDRLGGGPGYTGPSGGPSSSGPSIKSHFAKAGNATRQQFNDIKSKASSIIDDQLDGVKDEVNNQFDKVKDKVTNLKDRATEIGNNVNLTTDGIDKAMGEASELVDKIKSGDINPAELIKEAKISKGVADFVGDKKQAANNAFQDAIEKAKKSGVTITIGKAIDKAKSKFGDMDGDGDRDGGFKDQYQRRKEAAKEKAAALKEKLKLRRKNKGKDDKSGGGLFGGMLSGLFGKLSGAIGGLTTTLGGLFGGSMMKSLLGKLSGNVATDAATSAATKGGKGGLLRMAGRGVLRAGSFIGRQVLWGGARALAMGAASAVTAIGAVPLLIGAAIVGGGYLAYRLLTDKDNTVLNQLRFAQYGTEDYEDAKSDDIAKILFLEKNIGKYISYDNTGTATIKGIDAKASAEIFKGFGADVEDEEEKLKFKKWLYGRFMPIYLLWATRIRQNAPEASIDNLESISKLNASIKKQIFTGCRLDANHPTFQIIESPFESGWFADDLLDGSAVKEAEADLYAKLLEEVKEEKDKKAKASTTPFHKVKDSEVKKNSDGTVTAGNKTFQNMEAFKRAKAMHNESTTGKTNTRGRKVTVKSSDLLMVSKDFNNPNDLDAIRFKAYGCKVLESNTVKLLYRLELEAAKWITQSGGIKFEGDVDSFTKEWAPKFGLTDPTQSHRFSGWFKHRFLPVLVNHFAATNLYMKGSNPLDLIVGNKNTALYDIALAILGTKSTVSGKAASVWDYNISPFGEVEVDASSAGVYLQRLKMIRDKSSTTKIDSPKESLVTSRDALGSRSKTRQGGASRVLPKTVAASAHYLSDNVNRSTVSASLDTSVGYSKYTASNSDRSGISKLIMDIAKDTGVNPKTLMSIAEAESRLKYNVKDRSTGREGLFQFTNNDWNKYMSEFGNRYGIPSSARPTDPIASTLIAAELLKRTGGNSGNSAAEFLLTKRIGVKAATSFLNELKNNPDGKVSIAKFKNAIVSDPGIFKKGSKYLTYQEAFSRLGIETSEATDTISADKAIQRTKPKAKPDTIKNIDFSIAKPNRKTRLAINTDKAIASAQSVADLDTSGKLAISTPTVTNSNPAYVNKAVSSDDIEVDGLTKKIVEEYHKSKSVSENADISEVVQYMLEQNANISQSTNTILNDQLLTQKSMLSVLLEVQEFLRLKDERDSEQLKIRKIPKKKINVEHKRGLIELGHQA